MLEREYQTTVLDKLRQMFPACLILKNDSSYQQGIPDWLILFRDKWAMLEIKASEKSRRQPNQDYYVDLLDQMSFAAFICPENERDVLDALQRSFQARRTSRIS